MLTVSQLARQFQISRTTILYYERAGLLQPATRSSNGYRWYGENEAKRLESILAYRSFGVSIKHMAELLDRKDSMTQEQILLDQFHCLEKEIQTLRLQQKAIVMLLKKPALFENKTLDKERWTEVMAAAGFSEENMKDWHANFECMEPAAHQQFLESLGIEDCEIKTIRAWSKKHKNNN